MFCQFYKQAFYKTQLNFKQIQLKLSTVASLNIITIQLRKMNDLLINAQGQVYVNSNMKMLSLSVLLKKRLLQMSKSLQQQLGQCKNNKCLSKVEKKIQTFEQKKVYIENYMQQVTTKMEYQYVLCNDMIYENDIKVCRKEAKQRLFKSIGHFINEVNLPKLSQSLNSPN